MSTKNIEAIYPLSPMQEGILVHTLYAPTAGVYFVQFVCTLRGALDVPAFERAWQRVVDRHPVLRTLFVWKGRETPLQVVRRQVDIPWQHLDWRDVPAGTHRRRLEDVLREDRRAGFELTRAPLMRLTLIRLDDETYTFIWSYHHLLLDGWSLPHVFGDLFTCYESFRRGEEPHLSTPRPYRDYIKWLQAQDVTEAEAYWRRHLEGFTAPTPLVVDQPAEDRPESANLRYDEVHTQVSAETTRVLHDLARRHHVTLSTIIQAGWALLLNRYSGESDVVFGSTVAGRPAELAGVESMVGLFVNTLPVRVDVPAHGAITPWLQALQAQLAESRQYQHTPLMRIREWSDVPQETPLFESIFVFENYPMDAAFQEQRGSLDVTNIRSVEMTNYPLGVMVVPGGELTIRFLYERRRFDEPAIRRMLRHFRTILEQLAEADDLSQIDALTDSERNTMLHEWNNTQMPYPDDVCIHRLIEEHARERPDAPAVVYEGEDQLTYAELDRRANQLAHHLRKRGVGPEVLVGICFERSPEMIVGMLGVLKAGGAFVPLDPAYPEERLRFMLEDANAPILLTQSHVAETVPAADAHIVSLDTEWATIADEPTDAPAVALSPDNLAYMIYTSGSTGRPKGAMIAHRGVCNMAEAQIRTLGLHPEHRILQFSSLSFDASIFETIMALRNGATLYLGSREGIMPGPGLLRRLRDWKITNITIPPSLLMTLPADELPNLETIIVAGEACPADLVARWSDGRRFFNAYGPTEATIWATIACCTDGTEKPPIGRPIANTHVYVLDEQLRPVPPGVPGELHIGGVGLARGYRNQPARTAASFIPNPFSDTPGSRLYATGDLVTYEADGTLEFLGRIDHQVKIRGFRVEPGEVEVALGDHEGVRETVVVARKDETDTKQLVAYIVPEPDYDADAADLRAHVRSRLPAYMVPSTIVELEQMPLSPNGKIDRAALPAPDASRDVAGVEYVAPRTEVERTIATIWQDVLDLDKVGRNDNFFDLGGHSLHAVRVYGDLQEELDADLELVDIFQYPTISALTAHIRRENGATSAQQGRKRAQSRRRAMQRRRNMRA